MLTNEQEEQLLSALPGERVTKQYIESRIVSGGYITPENTTMTICLITLDNGYTVRGEAACVDPANFNPDLGQKFAYDDAFRKLWPLFGFLLAEKRHLTA